MVVQLWSICISWWLRQFLKKRCVWSNICANLAMHRYFEVWTGKFAEANCRSRQLFGAWRMHNPHDVVATIVDYSSVRKQHPAISLAMLFIPIRALWHGRSMINGTHEQQLHNFLSFSSKNSANQRQCCYLLLAQRQHAWEQEVRTAFAYCQRETSHPFHLSLRPDLSSAALSSCDAWLSQLPKESSKSPHHC